MAMRRWIAALVMLAAAPASLLAAAEARAQPDLPPPPPPPMGPPEEAPSLPSTGPPHGTAPAHRGGPAATPSAAHHPHVTTAALAAPSEPPPVERPIAITLSPLGLPWGRLSASVEMLIARHQSLVAAPNVLVAQADRGGAHALLSEGFGFASRPSTGVGLELGYHYWLYDAPSLRGPFFGPSILFGGTTQANVGDSSHLQGYWGVAFDAGFQEVLAGGFTFGGGIGLGLMRMADFTAAFPRALACLGWSL